MSATYDRDKPTNNLTTSERPSTTLFLGGARSGKSAIAEQRALSFEGPVVYLATGVASDDDMNERIQAHQARRHPRFRTVESGLDLGAVLAAIDDALVVVDSLGTWVARHRDFVVDVDSVTTAVSDRSRRGAVTVIVSDEVGLGVHPETELGRDFRDSLGLVNQRVAEIADEVLLVVAGRVLPLQRAGGS